MIKVFDAIDKIYTSNGNIVLQTIKAKVHKEDNGDFYINVEAPISENKVKDAYQEEGSTITGTSFTITNDSTKLNKLTTIYGNTTQASTPTPDSPIPVNVVSGRQEVSVAGKNLFNKDSGFRKGYINSSGNFVSSGTTACFNQYISCKPNTTYTISFSKTIANMTAPIYYDNNKNYLSRATAQINLTKRTITTPNNCYYMIIQFNYDNTSTMTQEIIDSVDCMVEIGDTASQYEAYKGQSYEINLGKNLLDLVLTSGTLNQVDYTNNNGEITLNGTASDNGLITSHNSSTGIFLQAGTYTLSANNSVAESNNTYIRLCTLSGTAISGTGVYLGTVNNKITFTLTSDTKVRFQIRIGNGITYDNFVIYPQLEKGSFASSFSTYKTPIELCKIGDYQDRIYKENGKWYIHKEIGKIVLNGSENWNNDGGTQGTDYRHNIYYASRMSIPSALGTSNTYLSNYFTQRNVGSDSGNLGSFYMSNGWLVFVDKNKVYDLAQWKTWLGTHNTIVYYVLKTPTTTEITDSELISQLNSIELLEGLNNVSVSSGDLAGEITIHYNFVNAPAINIKYIEYLVPNNIIVANTPQGDQAFRITNVENTRTKIKIKAYHVFYDSKNYLIQDSYVVDKNCNDALDHLNNSTDNTSPFTTISDITKIASYRCVRKSLYEAIQVLLERYGGHLVRDDWTIGIRNSIGQDNGVMIRYGKNLKDIKATYNWDNVVTKLLPVGKDGILLNALDPTNDVYLESQNQYDIPYTKTVSFDQSNIVEDDYKDEETGEVDEEAYKQALINDLAEQGQNYLQINSVPVVNYTLSANVEKISDIGDTILVVDEKLGINLETNIISYEYDCILDKYTQIEFGNFTPTLSGLMNSITNQAQKIVDESIATIEVTLGDELKEAQEKIWNALGNSYVIYEGDKILVVDSLPKETATNVIMINNGGIGFSQTGINGTFQSAWTIDNVLNMEQINVINLTADLIKGGTLKLGSNLNQNGQIEVYDEANSLIAELNKNGLKMYGVDGSYILMNNTVGFAGYDRLNNPIYWVSKDEFHMKKSVVEEEITLCNKLRFIPITITDNQDNIVNDGIGLVSVAGGGN